MGDSRDVSYPISLMNFNKNCSIEILGSYLQEGQDSSVGKNLDFQPIERRFEPHCQWDVSLYGPLASPSLQIASVALEHPSINIGGPNQWIIRANIIPRLSTIYLSLLRVAE